MSGKVRAVAAKLVHSQRLRSLLFTLSIISACLGLLSAKIESTVPEATIRNWGDGLWYAATTVTGVGYGDLYPVTLTGRMIGVVLETFGVVMFGSVVAIVSVELLRYQEDFYMRRVFDRIDELESKISEVKKQMDFLIKAKKS